MKTITSTVLGLSLTLASAGFIFAGQTAPAPSTTDNSAPVAKKHVKKNKKAVKNGNAPATAATPAPATK